jgi:uncharacterized protein YbaA (DUF1428 family)
MAKLSLQADEARLKQKLTGTSAGAQHDGETAKEKMSQDSEMMNMEMPFDASRMFWGGFEQVVNQ